jgi:hypothetical protein
MRVEIFPEERENNGLLRAADLDLFMIPFQGAFDAGIP